MRTLWPRFLGFLCCDVVCGLLRSARFEFAHGYDRRAKSTSLRRTKGWAVNKASQINLRGLWRLWAWKRWVLAMRGDVGLATAAPTKSATWRPRAALDKARALFSSLRGEKIRERLTDGRLRGGRVDGGLTGHGAMAARSPAGTRCPPLAGTRTRQHGSWTVPASPSVALRAAAWRSKLE